MEKAEAAEVDGSEQPQNEMTSLSLWTGALASGHSVARFQSSRDLARLAVSVIAASSESESGSAIPGFGFFSAGPSGLDVVGLESSFLRIQASTAFTGELSLSPELTKRRWAAT